MSKQKCPACGSTRLYNDISIAAKKNVNTGRVYDVDVNNEDNFFETIRCEKCGWNNEMKVLEKMSRMHI